jgi:prepilin-type processing-associated H-X9-DG protein
MDRYQPKQDVDTDGVESIFAFGSAHSSAFNMAFCDASVHAVSYDIDPMVHRESSTRQ